MAGLYEIWRDPDAGRGRPRPVPLDLHRAHHPGRGRRRPHPRPDAADGRARPVGRLARPGRLRARRPARRCSCRRRPGGSRRTRSPPTVNNVRNNGPELRRAAPGRGRPAREPSMTAVAAGRHAARRRPAASCTAPRGPVATLLLSHGAGGGIEAPRPGGAGRGAARAGRHRGPVRAAVAGRRQEDRAPPRRRSTSGCVAAADALRPRTPLVVGGRSAAPGRRPRRAASWAPSAAWRCVPAAPARAGPRSRGSTSCTASGVPTLVVQGERDSIGRPEEFPDGRRPRPSSPPPTTASRCPARGRSTRTEALGLVVEATLEWLVREVRRESLASQVAVMTRRARADRPYPHHRYSLGVRSTDHPDRRTDLPTGRRRRRTGSPRSTSPTETDAERTAALRARRAALPRPALLAPRCG